MKVHVNGETVEVPDGTSISVTNGVVTIGTTTLSKGQLEGLEKLVVEGNTGLITTDKSSVQVKGDVQGSVKAGGSVQCNNIVGDVDCGGSVNCGTVGKNVDAGGSVNCGYVGGNVDAGGSVRYNK